MNSGIPLHNPNSLYQGPYPDLQLIILLHLLAFTTAIFAFFPAKGIHRIRDRNFLILAMAVLPMIRVVLLTQLEWTEMKALRYPIVYSVTLTALLLLLFLIVVVKQLRPLFTWQDGGKVRRNARKHWLRESATVVLLLATLLMPLFALHEEKLLWEWMFYPEYLTR